MDITQPDQTQKSNTFGLVALVLSIGSLFVPKLFVSLVLIATAVFILLAFFKDKHVLLPIIACLISAYTISLLLKAEQPSSPTTEVSTCDVKYEVICAKCTVTYINDSGGENEIEIEPSPPSYEWSKSISVKQDTHVSVFARTDNGPVHVKAFVNGLMVREEHSNTDYSSASVSFRPDQFLGKR
ncbi:hypothetical protein [Dyadobacter sp. OTU695]|uniref:hypothetical protein n=1 Tax=Dyadobacter sp. OTU695 TaxID=3043860 RepID=UPI00313C02A1